MLAPSANVRIAVPAAKTSVLTTTPAMNGSPYTAVTFAQVNAPGPLGVSSANAVYTKAASGMPTSHATAATHAASSR